MEDQVSSIFNKEVRVHISPVAALGIIDHFMRRDEGQEVIVGSLFGFIKAESSCTQYYVKSYFPIPIHHGADIRVDSKYHQTRTTLHRKIYQKDSLLGWYCNEFLDPSKVSEFHDNYIRDIANPEVPFILIKYRSLSKDQSFPWTAFIKRNDQLVSVPCQLSPVDPDRSILSKLATSRLPILLDNKTTTTEFDIYHLKQLLKQAHHVMETDKSPERISQLLAALEMYAKDFNLDKETDTWRQDLIMLKYLAQLYHAELECCKRIS